MSKTSLNPAQLAERARLAANARWAREPDRLAATAPGLRAIQEHFERLVDPEGVLSPQERAKRVKNARQEQLSRARLKAARKRRDAVAMADAHAETPATKNDALDATLAHILRTVPMSDETRARIAEVIAQGGGNEH
jgi:hypothetical protein